MKRVLLLSDLNLRIQYHQYNFFSFIDYMPLRLFGQNQSLILGSSPNALEIGMEEESVLIRKGETAVGNLLAVDVPEELTRQNLKSAAYGQTWSYISDPTVELLVTDWDSSAENYIKPKFRSVPSPAIDTTTDDGLVFQYIHLGKPGETVFPEGFFLSVVAAAYSMGDLAAIAVVDQLGGLESGAVIATEDGGSALPVAKLQYEHVRNGPNKNSIRYSVEAKTDGMEGYYFNGATAGVSVPIDPLNPPTDLAKIMDGAGTDAEKQTAAGLIDWSKKIGTQWFVNLIVAAVMKSHGAKVTQSPGLFKAKLPLLQLYKSYEEDPAFVAGM